MRYCFIVNPAAGAGSAMDRFHSFKSLMDLRGMDYGFVLTERPGHAPELARAALFAGETAIVAVGGDGTAQEVASALKGSGAAMGVLPFGTGNDFAKGLGIPNTEEALLDMLLRFHLRRVDGAYANGRFFINVAGFGFDAEVVVNTEKYKKRYRGMLPYMLGIFEALLRLKPIHIAMRADGGEAEELDVILLSACNGTHFAGGINLAPEADQSDGLLDICIVTKLNRLGFLNLLPRYIKGRHLHSRHIRYFKAKEVGCESLTESALNLDGELYSHTPARFTIEPGALNMIVNG